MSIMPRCDVRLGDRTFLEKIHTYTPYLLRLSVGIAAVVDEARQSAFPCSIQNLHSGVVDNR